MQSSVLLIEKLHGLEVNMDNYKRFIAIPACLLTACATQKTMIEPQSPLPLAQQTTQNKSAPEAEKSVPGAEKAATISAKSISSWEIRGAMAAKNRNKVWSATMNWVQRGPSSYHLRLMGPLGAGSVLIDKTGSNITYKDGPKQVHSTNADQLLFQQTGVRLPVNNLYYWVRGLPAPGKVSSERYDQYHQLSQLQQNGYTISFGNYTRVKGVSLPGMVRLEGNGAMVKVLIRSWSF